MTLGARPEANLESAQVVFLERSTANRLLSTHQLDRSGAAPPGGRADSVSDMEVVFALLLLPGVGMFFLSSSIAAPSHPTNDDDVVGEKR